MSELPIGFTMALAMNEKAMRRFATMSEQDKRSLIARAHSVGSKEEMQALVDGLSGVQ